MSKRDWRIREEIGFTNLCFGTEKIVLPLLVPAIIRISRAPWNDYPFKKQL